MENIPIKDLQNLANIIANEQNISLKNQLSAWVTAKAGNSDHVALSSLSGLAYHSGVKEQIMSWISSVTTPKPEFIYVPDTPMEMIEQPEEIESPKIEQDAFSQPSAESLPLCEPSVDSPPLEQGISQSEEPTQESHEVKNEEEVKPKRTRKKKSD